MNIKSMADAVEKLRQYVMTECNKHDYCTDDCPLYYKCDMQLSNWPAVAAFAEAYDLDHEGRA